MNVSVVALVAIVIVVIAALAIWYFIQNQRRHKELREQFGPEYDRAVESYGERRTAEHALEARAERVAALDIRPLNPNESKNFGQQWHQVQTDFVDDPEGAIRRADALCGQVMQARGYPMGDFEQRAADVSVDHPAVVENYRAAHALAGKAERGDASTEDLRQAMVHYRTLFEDLIDTREPARMEQR
jgi:hypothetical protein